MTKIHGPGINGEPPLLIGRADIVGVDGPQGKGQKTSRPRREGTGSEEQDKMRAEKKEMRGGTVFILSPAGKATSGLPVLLQTSLCKITEPNRIREHITCITVDNWQQPGRGRKNEK